MSYADAPLEFANESSGKNFALYLRSDPSNGSAAGRFAESPIESCQNNISANMQTLLTSSKRETTTLNERKESVVKRE